MNPEEWLLKVRPFWPLLLIFCIVLSGTVYGVGPAILVASAGLLILALVLSWLSLGELTSEEPLTLEEALELAAPDHREQEKARVLRALKDLEQEHRFGKITDAEFNQESSRLRHQAKRLLATLDESAKARKVKVEAQLKRLIKNQPAISSDSERG